MTPAPFRWAMRNNLAQIRHVTPVRPRAATGSVARVYAAAEREFGLLAPPLALHSPEPDLLAASWLLLRETVLATGAASRAEKETVAAAVSLANACPYCVEVHGAVLGGIGDRADAASITAGRPEDVADPVLRAAARWARDPSGPAPAHEPELLAVMLAFHYLNRMVGVYLPDSPLPPGLPPTAAAVAGGVLGRVLRPTAQRVVTPGADLDLLPAAELPPDLEWAAAAQPALGEALSRIAAAVGAAGRRVLEPSARGVVLAELAARGGRLPQLGEDWITPVVSGLAPALRPVARLALLTAVVPHQVGAADVEAFRRSRPADGNSPDGGSADGDLVAVTSWAAFTAARRLTATAARPQDAVSCGHRA